MKLRTKLTAIAGIASLASLGFVAPALAGGQPATCPTTSSAGAPNSGGGTNYGGDCNITGTISITSAVSFATNETSFSLDSAALNTPSTTFQIQIASNDGNGYYVSTQGPSGGFTDGGTVPLPDSAVSVSAVGQLAPGGQSCASAESGFASRYVVLPDPGQSQSAQEVVGAPGVSGSYNCGTFSGYTPPTGDDSFNVDGFELTTVNGTPTGTYTGTVQMAAWGV